MLVTWNLADIERSFRMSKINFTSSRISSFTCDPSKSQTFVWDSKSPGLGLRATAGGSKSYIFQSKFNGQTIRTTIGDVKSWSIELAQERARYLQTLVDQGIDPREHIAEKKAAHSARRDEARRQEVQFEEAWNLYIESRKPFWGSRTLQDHIRHSQRGGMKRVKGKGVIQPGPIAQLLDVRLKDLSGTHLTEWLQRESEKRPTMVALSFRMVRGFIRWAAEHPEYASSISSDAYKARSVKDALPRVKAKEGDSLQKEQLQPWFSAVRSLGNPIMSAYLQGLLIVGPRREEWASLKWSDIDFTWKTIILNDKVEGTGGRTVPLTPYLASLLLELKHSKEQITNDKLRNKKSKTAEKHRQSEWVFFSSNSADGKISEPRIAHNQALEKAGIPHITLHGLRRSFGTLAEWCEVPVGVVAQIQGHKPSAIAEKHYRRRPIDLLRKWHEQIEAWILNEAKLT